MRIFSSILLLLALLFFGLSTPASAQSTAPCSATYTVVLGDTMAGIARKCGVDYNALLAANTSISNPALIFPGQVVNIPPGGSIPNTGNTGSTYTVVVGDTLSGIAFNHNVTLAALLAANPSITNADLIFAGQVINLPAGSSSGPGIPTTGGSGRTYTVKLGDTLSGIAVANNTTVATLTRLNPWITNPDFIVTGWVISLP